MRDTILALIKARPKHFSQMIKRDKLLVLEIESNSGITSNKLLDHIYSYITHESNICPYASVKTVQSIKHGYKFCGRASVCQCAKESVSKSVTLAKAQTTTEQKHLIEQKKQKTNIEKYGVANTGQLITAKEKHSEFYNDNDNVNRVNKQIATTKQARHGSSTFNNSGKTVATCRERYSVDNSFLLTENNSNPLLINLQDKTVLSELYTRLSIIEIAEHCNVHIQTVYKWLNQHSLRSPYQSTGEQEVYNYLVNDLGIAETDIIRNTRKIIGKELDLYLPSYGIAIEYNGIYWHHEDVAHITKTYHYDKFKACEDLNIQLINILSVDWDNNKDKIKRIVAHRLGLANRDRVFARKCTVESIAIADTRDILNDTHIQGYTTSQIAYGLVYNGITVAVMTFSKPRAGIGKKRDNCFELVRFTTSVDIPGGASKLLAHFKKTHTCDIISYSDNSWSNGNMYRQLGFELEKEQPPSYWYYRSRDTKLMHRYNFTKYKLVEQGHSPLKTEKQITKEIGLLRYWDAGKRVWILKH